MLSEVDSDGHAEIVVDCKSVQSGVEESNDVDTWDTNQNEMTVTVFSTVTPCFKTRLVVDLKKKKSSAKLR